MTSLLPFIVGGLATGAVYGLAGTGLVLTYKTTGLLNLAHGAVAAAAAYLFYWLHVELEWGWIPAFILTVPVLGIALGLAFEVLGRKLAHQRMAYKIVGTIGVVLIIQGLAAARFGHSALRLPQYLPSGSETFSVGGVNITYGQLTIIAIALLAVGGLYFLLQTTRLGLQMRAVVDDPALLSLHGTSPQRVRRIAWCVGTVFATLSGVLVAPQIGIESVILTYLVVQAFGAAAIGGFSSIPWTFAGGLALGVVASLSTKFVLTVPILKGLPQGLPFIVLIVALMVLPKRKMQQQTGEARPALPWTAPVPVQVFMGFVLTIGLILIPFIAGSKLSFYTVGLTQAIMLLSLGFLVRTAGMVSLGHAVFGAIGAVAFAQLIENFQLPWFVAVILGALIVVPIAALLALPAIRLSGLFLALATLGFAIGVERIFYSREFMFTSRGEGRRMPRPDFALSDRSFYYVVLGFFIFAVICILLLRSSRLGRVVRGMSESNTAVNTLGLNTDMTRTIVFCISGFFAGLAGILYGATIHFAVFGDKHYASFASLVLLATLAVVPFREPWYALFAAVAAVIPGYWTADNATDYLNVMFGAFAIMVAINGGTHQMPMKLRAFFEKFDLKKNKLPAPEVDTDAQIVAPTTQPVLNESGTVPARVREGDLVISNLTVKFGGHLAVNSLNLKAPAGKITGLIGPNGAGKTTTFNAASGLVRPTEGTIHLGDQDISNVRIDRRARYGLGRTFQIMQLCESLTVESNVLLGAESGMIGNSVTEHIWSAPANNQSAREAADRAIELTGIGDLRNLQAGELSTGQRRLVELARCLAGDFNILMLDEPSSGLDQTETEEFGRVIQSVVAEQGCGILLVEHDMKLVMDVCDYIYVLDFGELLFEGTPNEVATSVEVQAAYLGNEATSELVEAGS